MPLRSSSENFHAWMIYKSCNNLKKRLRDEIFFSELSCLASRTDGRIDLSLIRDCKIPLESARSRLSLCNISWSILLVLMLSCPQSSLLLPSPSFISSFFSSFLLSFLHFLSFSLSSLLLFLLFLFLSLFHRSIPSLLSSFLTSFLTPFVFSYPFPFLMPLSFPHAIYVSISSLPSPPSRIWWKWRWTLTRHWRRLSN